MHQKYGSGAPNIWIRCAQNSLKKFEGAEVSMQLRGLKLLDPCLELDPSLQNNPGSTPGDLCVLFSVSRKSRRSAACQYFYLFSLTVTL
jgi:hypothetical protein